jgi:hypothetical protein
MLGIAMLLVVFWIVIPMWSAASLHAERISVLRRQALVMEGLAKAAPQFEAQTRKLAANSDIQVLTFSAQQSALAVAQLQGVMSQTFADASAAVTSSVVLPEVREGALLKISVQTAIESDLKGLVKALHTIAMARPLLKVEKLSLRDPDGDWAVTGAATQANRLQVEIVVSAYLRVS